MNNIYTVQDAKAAAFLGPFFASNDQLAIRQVAAAVTDVHSMFFKFPEDYTLYRIGRFDELTGAIEGHEPEAIMSCLQMKAMYMTEISDAT